MKRDFLVCYDYGMGGVWGVVHVRAPEEITARFPELTVFESRPHFITDEIYRMARENRSQDIDAAHLVSSRI